MKAEINEVLRAVSSNGKYKGQLETAYQLGVLAAWVARLSKSDWSVSAELNQRLRNKK